MKIMKSKGMIFIGIKKLVQKIEERVQVVYWSLVKPSIFMYDLIWIYPNQIYVLLLHTKM